MTSVFSWSPSACLRRRGTSVPPLPWYGYQGIDLRPRGGSCTRRQPHRLKRHGRRELRTAGQGNRLTQPYAILNTRDGNAGHETRSPQSGWFAHVSLSLSLAAVVVRDGVSGRPDQQNRI